MEVDSLYSGDANDAGGGMRAGVQGFTVLAGRVIAAASIAAPMMATLGYR